jgi:hypothetical protein
MPRDRREASCSLTGGLLPARDVLGVTLAHELGHSLHLRHIEDEPLGAKVTEAELSRNLMKRDLEVLVPGEDVSKLPAPHEYRILPYQRYAAHRFGRCAGRFKGVKPRPEDRCDVLFRELGLAPPNK